MNLRSSAAQNGCKPDARRESDPVSWDTELASWDTELARMTVTKEAGHEDEAEVEALWLRCDWGPQYIADTWINEVKWLGMTITPSYVGEPECNGVIERF